MAGPDAEDARAEALIRRFYAAFAQRDHHSMAACYAADAQFSDPVFPALRGTEIGLMWRMLCERATDLRIEAGGIKVAGNQGTADWQAWYTYSATGRTVHNRIGARFIFEQGLIRSHTDDFDLYRWARQAMGLEGIVLGWAPPVQRAIRRQAAQALDRFRRRQLGDA